MTCWMAAVLVLSGCATSTGPVHRHTLYLAPPANFASSAGPVPSVRVDLPRYVEDQHLVRRGRDGRLERLASHAWAESPDEGFARLLREHLAVEGGIDADRLHVQLSRFESGEDAIFYALGHWQLRSEGQVCAQGHLAFQEPMRDNDARELLHAMNRAVRYTASQITPC